MAFLWNHAFKKLVEFSGIVKAWYNKIVWISFLTDPLIKASKIPNLETKYLGQFWVQRSETFCSTFVRMRGNFY